jgi:hypothetical protein
MNPVNAYFRRLQGMETIISEQSGLLQELALETIQQIEIEVPQDCRHSPSRNLTMLREGE